METLKLLVNSTISTKGAKMFTSDISNMYLKSYLKEAEYVRFKANQIPQPIIDHYNLQNKIHKGQRAWYGLK